MSDTISEGVAPRAEEQAGGLTLGPTRPFALPLLTPGCSPIFELGLDEIPGPDFLGVPGCGYPLAIQGLIPPYPSSSPTPNVDQVKLVQVPWQRRLKEGYDPQAEGLRAVMLYRSACHAFYAQHNRAMGAHPTEHKDFARVLTWLATLYEEGIPPAVWIGFIMGAWRTHLGPPHLRAKPPPVNMVFNSLQVAQRASWCHDEAGRFWGGTLVIPSGFSELLAGYNRMIFALCATHAVTVREQLTVFRHIFPGLSYAQRLTQIQKTAEEHAALLLKRDRAGEWVIGLY